MNGDFGQTNARRRSNKFLDRRALFDADQQRINSDELSAEDWIQTT
jgi:hypothetical protein